MTSMNNDSQQANTSPKFHAETLLLATRMAPLFGQFVILTLLIRSWGLEAVGAVSIVLTVAGLTGAIDFGVSAGSLRAIGQHFEPDSPKVQALLVINVVFNAVFVGALALISVLIVRLCSWTNIYPTQFIVLMGLFTMLGNQRTLVERVWTLDRKLSRLATTRLSSTLILVSLGVAVTRGPVSLTLLSLVFVASLSPFALAAGSIHLRPSHRPPLRWARSAMSHQLVSLQLVSIASLVNSLFDRILISAVFGLAATGSFDPASRVSGLQREVMVSSVQIHAADQSLFDSESAYASDGPAVAPAAITVRRMALIGGLAVLAAPSIPVLISSSLGIDTVLLSLTLSIGVAVNQIATPLSTSARALNLAGLERNYSLLTLALNLALTVILSILVGFIGVGLATSIALVTGTIYFGWTIARSSNALRKWTIAVYRGSMPELLLLVIAILMSSAIVVAAAEFGSAWTAAPAIAATVGCAIVCATIYFASGGRISRLSTVVTG